MLVLGRTEVERLLDPDELIEALARAMVELSSGRVFMVPRTTVNVPSKNAFLGLMGCYVPALGILESKLVSVFPQNAPEGRPTHQAVIVVFDPATGTPEALMDASYITEARTAAGSALATRLLARGDSTRLAVLGAGVQARAHALAIPKVRKIVEIRIAGRTFDKVEALARDLEARLDISVRPTASFAQAMKGTDIVCAATHSPDPVVRREWVEPGMHINSVGVNPEGREVDAETVQDALVVIEDRNAALASPGAAGANDLMWAIRDSVIAEDHIHGEIGRLITGELAGRTSADQITLYKSVGVAVQDAAAAALVMKACS